MQTFLYALHFIVCFVLIGVVLLQRGKGADLGASLGGGSANTIFGSRGAGNFLTRITTASAMIFMGTSLSLAYLGYKSSDVRLFDEDAPFEVPVEGGDADGVAPSLQEVPTGDEQTGGLVEIPMDPVGGAVDEAVDATGEAIDEAASAIGAAAGEAADAAAGVADDAVRALDAATGSGSEAPAGN
ncbi:MAG: preprotein translocase subunit SecG [Myxococcota bacterium]